MDPPHCPLASLFRDLAYQRYHPCQQHVNEPGSAEPLAEDDFESVPTSSFDAVFKMANKMEPMYDGMTRIVLNPRMIHASLNPNPGPGTPVSPINRAHIVVHKEHDLFCVSSFHSPWFPDYYFSGGIDQAHPALADIRLLAVSMPMCNRARVYSICRGCRRSFGGVPHATTSRVEFCRRCIKSWVAGFRQVERVYLIVPGVRRAQIGDEDVVYRFGNSATIDALLTALPQPPSSHTVVEYARLPASETCPATKLQGTQTIGAFGPGGPRSFDGSGISLFEVPAAEVPHTAVQILYTMFHGACQKRVEQARNDGVFSPSSTAPIHCGGTIEFKFLSY